MNNLNIAIMGSTNGSALPALYEKLKNIDIEICLVFSNIADAGILQKAQALSIPNESLLRGELNRKAYDAKVSELFKQQNINLIVLIGYMRILSNDFVKTWHDKIINIHPSLLPKHAGLMDLAVHQAVLDAGDKQSGCTAHLIKEQVDAGKILVQKKCDVLKDDTADSLKQRVQALESEALFDAIMCLRNAA